MSFKSFAVLPLLAMAALPIQAEEFNTTTILLNNPVLNAVSDAGTAVIVDGSACRSGEFMGRFVHDPDENTSFIELCTHIHEGDVSELMDTIRHEAFHLVQACEGGPIFSAQSLKAAADPDLVSYLLNSGDYPADKFHTELEARVVAAESSEEYIVESIEKYCI